MAEEFKFALRSKNASILYNSESRIRMIWYPNLEFEKIKSSFPFWHPFDMENSNSEPDSFVNMLEYNLSDYYNSCVAKYGKKTAGCLLNLFFVVPIIFSELPWKGKMPAEMAKKQILYYDIICERKQGVLLEKTLKLVFSKYKLNKSFEDYVTITRYNTGEADTCMFSMDIAAYNHIINPRMFAAKAGFIKKLDLRKVEMLGVIGRKFDPDGYEDPKENRFHPDAMSIEEKRRWSQ